MKLPRLGMIYAIISQGRIPELSAVQRMISMILFDNIADQKIYDRLQPVGLCLSYQTSLEVLHIFGAGSFNIKLVEAIKAGKVIRLVGDNVNFSVKVTDQHQSTEGKTKFMLIRKTILHFQTMHHAFASAALINHFNFNHLPDHKPQPNNLTVQDFLVNEADLKNIRQVYTILIASYESILQEAFGACELPLSSIQIGGDQLTRERFSGAKCLRAGAADIASRFGHLSPITFEMFHLLMNFLITFNKILFKNCSSKEIGTLKCEVDRLMRTNFDEDVRKAYDADKDFIVSFVDAHLVELMRDFFGMEDIYSPLQKHVPPEFENDEMKKRWVFATFGELVDTIVASNQPQSATSDDVIDDGQFVVLKLSSGKIIHVPVVKHHASTTPETDLEDTVFNYASIVVEMGLVYKELIDLCKLPDRERLIRVMKQCMIIFKAKSNNSKYALECHRFLVQHLVLMSERESTKVIHSLFVNTTGSPHSHIPADLQMEYLVKDIKKHMKHMFSNKTMSNIATRTRGLSCLKSIAEQYDTQTYVKARAKKHQRGSYFDDELVLVKDLQQLQPFQNQPGRFHSSFPKMHKTMLKYLDIDHFHD
ncbi:uncharacterized protein LOC117319009 [Pecten maximus]|uniref:uncharacterized protein LOC117319009 n=1 Tax=Pecten maximus TaxID=6579 RepID=UPI0014580341|nr:uncharacterized protein LOC117319009 [Pecten maximus]